MDKKGDLQTDVVIPESSEVVQHSIEQSVSNRQGSSNIESIARSQVLVHTDNPGQKTVESLSEKQVITQGVSSDINDSLYQTICDNHDSDVSESLAEIPLNQNAKTFLKQTEMESRHKVKLDIDGLDKEIPNEDNLLDYIKFTFKDPIHIIDKPKVIISVLGLLCAVLVMNFAVFQVINRVLSGIVDILSTMPMFHYMDYTVSFSGGSIISNCLITFLVVAVLVAIDKGMGKWLLNEEVSYVSLFSLYANIYFVGATPFLIPFLFGGGKSLYGMEWIVAFLFFGFMMIGVGLIVQMYTRAKDAKNRKIPPFYYVIFTQLIMMIIGNFIFKLFS